MSEDYDLYTTTQENVLAFLPYFTAPLSVLGSSLILYAIWFDRKELLKHVFHRLMLGISSLDLLTSLNMIILGPWVVPADWDYGRSGRGTVGTCEASAFLLNFLLGSMIYSAFLALYFVLLINFEVKQRRIAKYMEPLAHGLAVIFPLFIGTGGLVEDLFNPLWELPGFCWFSENPPLCSSTEDDCIRGYPGGAEVFRASFSAAMLGTWVWIVLCMAAIVLKVQKRERSMSRYHITGQPASYSRTKETSRQAIWYIVVFFVVFSPTVIVLVLTETVRSGLTDNKKAVFTFALLTKIFTPLQGCFNAFIYFRKRFSKLIRPGESLAFVAELPFGIGDWIVERNNTPSNASVSSDRRRLSRRTISSPCKIGNDRPAEGRTNGGVSEAVPSADAAQTRAEVKDFDAFPCDEPSEQALSSCPEVS